ncbi:MAG: YhbY family RNA-binding protein [Lactobacillus sp.]|jgi:RNA-binding protein|nr:YhbY family RNA-binding protein [Lactobacillus sp.]
MLTGKQKRFLRAQANVMRPLMQIGKNELTDNFLKQLLPALDKRELIKISILQNTDLTPKQVAQWLVDQDLNLEVPQVIGHSLLVYRPASKEKYQVLSKKVQAI